MHLLLVLTALVGCKRETLYKNCATRAAYYPDADGDGVGEPTDVYYGCEAPLGWVAVLPAGPTGTTGSTVGASSVGLGAEPFRDRS